MSLWKMSLQALIFSIAFQGTMPVEVLAQTSQLQNEPWVYQAGIFSPFWKGETIHDEPILFVVDSATGAAKGDLLFPVSKIDKIISSDGKHVFQDGVDYEIEPGTHEITIPAGSKIKTVKPEELRRKPGSQPYRLTHRDGGDEIMFGGKLEYHELQTWVTYKPSKLDWPQEFTPRRSGDIPVTREKLQSKSPLNIVLLGDSISTGCNASAWGEGAPFQPAYQDLLLQHLQTNRSPNVTLSNLSVGGMTAPWGISKIEEVVGLKPDLVVIAFGMNDVGGFSPEDYQKNIKTMIEKLRQSNPTTEVILVATMLGNADWTALKHENFPRFRDALAELCGEGVALADMTTVWEGMLTRKKDADLTGNGVNHPNDFGHRVYAQVLSELFIAPK